MVYLCIHCGYRLEISLKKSKLNIKFLSSLNHYELCPKCGQHMLKIKE